MTALRRSGLALLGSMIAIELSASVAFAQSAALEVGIVLAKDGEVVAAKQSTVMPVEKYSVLIAGTTLRLGGKAGTRLVHNREGATYVIAGPALVTVSLKGLEVVPSSAVVSRTDSRPPVEQQASGGAPMRVGRPNLRVGGENLGTTRSGLMAGASAAAEKAAAEQAAAGAAERVAKKAATARAAAEPERVAAERAAAERAAAAAAAAEKAKAAAGEEERERNAAEKAREQREMEIQKMAGRIKASPAEKAISAIPPEKLASMDPREVAFKEAEALEATNVRAAVRMYERLARAGYGKAAARLAQIYDNGMGNVPRDYAETLKWKQMAEALGVDSGLGAQAR